MDYDDAVETDVSAEVAEREIARHHLSFADFQREVGIKTSYTGQEVLDWLGY